MMRILICEDEPAIADSLQYVLRQACMDSVWVTLGAQAIAAIVMPDSQQRPFDLLILDVGLPDMSGIAVCQAVRRHSQIPIVFLTARNDEVDRVVGLELGADDYIGKPFSPREVVARVNAVMRRCGTHAAVTELSPAAQHRRIGAFVIDDGRRTVTFFSQVLELTHHEYYLVSYLLRHPRRVFSRSQIMQGAWPQAAVVSERTIDTHIKSLRQKLKLAAPQQDPIKTHRGHGYSIDVDGVKTQ